MKPLTPTNGREGVPPTGGTDAIAYEIPDFLMFPRFQGPVIMYGALPAYH